MDDQAWRLSVDFGTTNTAAAVELADGSVRPVRLGARSDAMPSAVAIYRDEVLTGDSAVRIAGVDPSSFEPTPKRRLSEDSIVLGGAVHDPVELVAAVLRRTVAEAAKLVGHGGPSGVILTHPAAWDAYLKDRLADAAAQAGLEPSLTTLMPEPVAAAWHYATSSTIPDGARIAVIDFGGGTCDAAVLELEATPEGKVFEVLASDGIDPLGGHDFDDRLFQWTHDQLEADEREELVERLRREGSTADRSMLRDQVREAKHALSFHASAPIGVRSGDQEAVVTITRDEFDQLVDQDLDRAVSLARSVLSASGTSLEALYQLYLTGGSSSIPALQTKLTGAFGAKLGRMGDPKQVTSLGALQAPDVEFVPAPLPETDPKPEPVEESRPRRPWAKILTVLAGVAVVAVIIVLAVANAGEDDPSPKAEPTLTRSPTTTPPATNPPPQTCGGAENAQLTDDQCSLVDDFVNTELVQRIDPATCEENDPLNGASVAVLCSPQTLADYTPNAVHLYGFDSAAARDALMDKVIADYSATGPTDVSAKDQSWNTWDAGGGGSSGRLVRLVIDGAGYLIWDNSDDLVVTWVESAEGDTGHLYPWWRGS